MISDGAVRAMKRKAGEGRPPPEFGVMNPVRGWRVAVPKAADEAMDLVATALSVTEMRLRRDELTEDLPEGALIILLEGPSRQFGLAILDAQMMGGLIEAATTGRVGQRPTTPRQPTRTDAVICADLLDRLFEIYEENVAVLSDSPLLSGYRYATPLLDPRMVEMTLPEAPYRQFTLTIDMGNGAKTGEMRISFPATARQPGRAGEVDSGFQEAFRANVMSTTADLQAILHRVSMPLRQVMGLSVGDVIPVPLAALGKVRVEHVGGKRVSLGRLGQQGGFRAVRLREDDEDAAAPDAGATDFQAAAPAAAPARLPEMESDLSAGTPGFGGFDLGEEEGEASSGLPPLDDLPDLDGLPEIDGLPDLDQGDADDLAMPPMQMASLDDLDD